MSWTGFKTENKIINEGWVQKPEVQYPRPEGDPSGVPLNTPGAKADADKIRPWLMMSGFARALELVAEVTTKGAEKYTPNGWTEVPEGVERYMEGFARHQLKLGRGEIYDNGPGGIGTKHKVQMIWNLLASLELEEREKSSS